MSQPAQLSAGLKNWHWRQKNVDKWAYEWFRTNLANVKATDDSLGLEVTITSVSSIDGDVTVGQRKSKVITIYDLDMKLDWAGRRRLADGTDLSGSVRIPEVSHEAIDGISDYVFDFSSSSSSTPAYQSTRKILPEALKTVFATFQTTLVEVHGKDLLAVDSKDVSPAASAPASTPATPVSSVSKSEPVSVTGAVKKINTSVVKVESSLRISAADLWDLLTVESKIPTWSRSAAQFSATPSAPFSMFSGSVNGTVVSADKPKKLVLNWGLNSPTWPKDHLGVLTIELNQGSDSTTATFTLDGVPKGHEREIESNLHAFYIRGFVTMGLVKPTSELPPTGTKPSLRSNKAPAPSSSSSSKLSPSSSLKKKRKEVKGQAPAVEPQGRYPLAGVTVVGALVVVLGGIVFNSLRD
ncbi:Uncharacterized conserved protein [Phaffia rhodozyma]|uniref:Uncharacterized conserved protein n=1 Tax=Phaffia rhodozyma TaxID=264483 RepID=A0A0F7SSL6_PHARH|nr:Uncharacterized conserved protein [Phaffia rhodozyma]